MLIPQIAAGAAEDLSEVRRAAQAAVDWVCEGSHIALLVPDEPVVTARWSLSGFGVEVGDGTPVGLAQGVGLWLLDGREATVVGPSADLSAFDGVLVMGDASASRTDKAPGHNNPQAIPFDDTVLDALTSGDAVALRHIDVDVAAAVAAAGAPAWAALGRAVDAVESASVDLAMDPFGVLYVVARWTVQWATPT